MPHLFVISVCLFWYCRQLVQYRESTEWGSQTVFYTDQRSTWLSLIINQTGFRRGRVVYLPSSCIIFLPYQLTDALNNMSADFNWHQIIVSTVHTPWYFPQKTHNRMEWLKLNAQLFVGWLHCCPDMETITSTSVCVFVCLSVCYGHQPCRGYIPLIFWLGARGDVNGNIPPILRGSFHK